MKKRWIVERNEKNYGSYKVNRISAGGNTMKHTIQIHPQKCIGCGLCISDCPEQNIQLVENKAVLTSQQCMKCGHCVAICPKEAISMTGFDHKPPAITQDREITPDRLLQAIQKQRSIRQFQNRLVPTIVLQDLLEAARFTPTAKNRQDVEYIVLDTKKEEIESVAVQRFKILLKGLNLFSSRYRKFQVDEDFFFKKAPLVILVLSRDKTDAVLAASHMALMAQAHGLGVLYSGFFTMLSHLSFKIRRMLSLPAGKKVQMTLVLGYPAVRYQRGVQREPARVIRK